MNLCNIHNQWYVTHCVYCGKPGESKLQDLQTTEPFVMKLTKEQMEQLEQVYDNIQPFSQKLHDLFNLTRSKDAKRQTEETHPPTRFRDIGNAE